MMTTILSHLDHQFPNAPKSCTTKITKYFPKMIHFPVDYISFMSNLDFLYLHDRAAIEMEERYYDLLGLI